MQITTLEGQRSMMPECIITPLADGTTSLSTVHHPEEEHSFYRDIAGIGHFLVRDWKVLLGDFISTLAVYDEPVASSHMIATQVNGLSAEEIVNSAKKVTGLSIKDLASIFDVTRQTLYNFRKGQGNISERNWRRLNAVEIEIENLSKTLPTSPGSLCKHFVFEGDTLYDLLCSPQLDRSKINKLANALALKLEPSRQAKNYHPASIDQLTRHG